MMTVANHSRWDDIKATRPAVSERTRSAVEDTFVLAQLIHDLRIDAGLTQKELADRMGTTQSVISRLEEGGGSGNRVDTLARVATALGRHLVISFPETVPAKLKDAVEVP
jgi:ribosome-binding protein aMBF1 (putative translation factor)